MTVRTILKLSTLKAHTTKSDLVENDLHQLATSWFVVRTLAILLAFFQALWAFTLIILRFGHPIGVFGIWLVLIGISSVLKVLIGCFFGVFWCFQFSQIHRLLSQRAGLARV